MASSRFNRKEFMSRLGKANRGIKLTEAHKNKISTWNKIHKWKPPTGLREQCPAWKGGTKISKDGYRLIYKPGHAISRKDGYILEHRFIMSSVLNRNLESKEVVHHKNGDRLDNRPENLELYKSSGKHISDNHTNRDSVTGRFR